MNDDAVRRAESGFMEALAAPESWPRVLADLSDTVGAYGAVILPVKGRVPGTPLTDNMAESAESYFREGWAERDGRMPGIPKLLRTGIVVEQDFITRAEMNRQPYWQELMEPRGLRWFGGLKVRSGEDIWCLALQRSVRQDPFGTDEQAGLLRLVEPLSRAATFARQVADARLGGLTDALEAVGKAGLILDRTGRVSRINRRAEILFGRDLRVARGELTMPGSAPATAALRRHIDAVIWADIRPDSPHLAPVFLPRPGHRPLLAQAHLLRGAVLDYFAPGRALLLITDPDEALVPSDGVLRRMFGLSEREAALARALAETCELPAAAKQLGVSYETARTYMKAVFAKTETANQAALLALLTRIGHA